MRKCNGRQISRGKFLKPDLSAVVAAHSAPHADLEFNELAPAARRPLRVGLLA